MKNLVLVAIASALTLTAHAGAGDIGSANVSRESDVPYVQSVSDCFTRTQQAYADMLKQRRDLENQAFDLEHAPGADLSQKLAIQGQIMGASTAILLEEMKFNSAISSGIYSNEGVRKLSPYCAAHGAILKTQ